MVPVNISGKTTQNPFASSGTGNIRQTGFSFGNGNVFIPANVYQNGLTPSGVAGIWNSNTADFPISSASTLADWLNGSSAAVTSSVAGVGGTSLSLPLILGGALLLGFLIWRKKLKL